jgi:hypothetical protein
MKALVITCTLRASPEKSNTEALAEVLEQGSRGGEDYLETEEGHKWSHT